VATQQRLINEYTDVAGGYLRASNWVPYGVSVGPLLAAIAAAQNAALQFSTLAVPVVGVAVPVGNLYRLTSDLALLNFQTAPGGSVQLAIPGPVAALFGPNSTVVDPSNGLAAAVIAAAIGTLCDASGGAVTAYISGSKSSRRTEQT
jgi:hypothetical protein